ncbi:hypothetical protein E2C01_052025 [Portunus trituberculatus]|uniref:Uncharacterized protein n=1 Tax=Portunus trituberculatus TaxID=210409 RepID=A0A5B7GKK8_PORTR|nr:hypothetical protein [Portunus trituberculatus]
MNFSVYNYYRYSNSPCGPLAAWWSRQRQGLSRADDAAIRTPPPPHSSPANIITRDSKARPGVHQCCKADVVWSEDWKTSGHKGDCKGGQSPALTQQPSGCTSLTVIPPRWPQRSFSSSGSHMQYSVFFQVCLSNPIPSTLIQPSKSTDKTPLRTKNMGYAECEVTNRRSGVAADQASGRLHVKMRFV